MHLQDAAEMAAARQSPPRSSYPASTEDSARPEGLHAEVVFQGAEGVAPLGPSGKSE